MHHLDLFQFLLLDLFAPVSAVIPSFSNSSSVLFLLFSFLNPLPFALFVFREQPSACYPSDGPPTQYYEGVLVLLLHLYSRVSTQREGKKAGHTLLQSGNYKMFRMSPQFLRILSLQDLHMYCSLIAQKFVLCCHQNCV